MAKKTKHNDFENFKILPIGVLELAPWNYKTNDSVLLQKLMKNIKRSGQVENILVRPLENGKYEVVNGNHRLMALNELKYEDVFVYDLGDITEAQAKRIAVETNETKFSSDPLKLAETIRELTIAFSDLEETAPFSQGELDNFSSLLDFNWDSEEKEETEDEKKDDKKDDKTRTVISAGGDEFKVLKLELSSKTADRFSSQLERLKVLTANQSEGPVNVISAILEQMTDDQLIAANAPEKKKKAAAKKK